MKKRYQVFLEQKLAERIEEIAAEEGKSKSSVIADIVLEHFLKAKEDKMLSW